MFLHSGGTGISVATTKAYSTQLIASYALAVQFGKVREQITEEKYQELIAELKTLPDKIAKIIEDDKERIQWFAAKQQMPGMLSLSGVVLTMPSVWKAALR